MKRVRVYLPRWMRWFVLGLLAPIWAVIAWQTFFNPDLEARSGRFEFFLATAIVVAVAAVVWAAGSRRLPIYEAEVDDAETPRDTRG